MKYHRWQHAVALTWSVTLRLSHDGVLCVYDGDTLHTFMQRKRRETSDKGKELQIGTTTNLKIITIVVLQTYCAVFKRIPV